MREKKTRHCTNKTTNVTQCYVHLEAGTISMSSELQLENLSGKRMCLKAHIIHCT